MLQRIIRLLIGVGILLLIMGGVAAQNIRILVVNEFLNIRIVPAIGARVIDTVEAGFVFELVTGRSGDGEWVRVDHLGREGWINLTPAIILQGDIASLPVADPRTIPFGGFDSPRAGFSQQQGPVSAKATDGLRVRAGPSTGYPTIANINFNQAFTITGRNRIGSWFQVNFEGTLGWISAQFVQILSGDHLAVPVGGIVAESVPPSGETLDDFVAVIRLMRERLDLAQPSLENIRSAWTDAAINGRATCQAFPARPSDFNVPVPLLAAFFDPLDSLVRDFNDAMFNVRAAIDLFIQVCNQPGTGNPVGQATAQGALDTINVAETQFVDLRQRLDALIPSFEVGPDECLLSFNNKQEILPLVNINAIFLDEFTRRMNARGYCFNGIEGQVLNIQTLPIPPSELAIFLSVSALDDPTNFITVGRGSAGQLQSIGPVILPRTTQYVLLLADLGGDGRSPVGRFAFRIADTTAGLTNVQNLAWDPETNSVILTDNPAFTQPFGGGQPTTPDVTTPGVICPSTEFSCNQLFTCDEALACFNVGNFALDANGDGIPCGASLCTNLTGGTSIGE